MNEHTHIQYIRVGVYIIHLKQIFNVIKLFNILKVFTVY